VLHRLNSAVTLIQRTTTEAPRQHMYYIGLDVHKKTISYCVKDVSGRIQLTETTVPKHSINPAIVEPSFVIRMKISPGCPIG
jgi:hypothetical protein